MSGCGHEAAGRPPVIERPTLGAVSFPIVWVFAPALLKSACVLLPVLREVDVCTCCLRRVRPLGVLRRPDSFTCDALLGLCHTGMPSSGDLVSRYLSWMMLML